MVITLTSAERRIALLAAENRQLGSRTLGCRDRFGASDPHGTRNRMGCCGELAVAKALGLPMQLSVNTFKNEPDFWYYGLPLEVRTSERQGTPLFFRTGDNPQAVFVHVTQIEPETRFRINGWAYGHDIRDYGALSGDPTRPRFPALKPDQLSKLVDLMYQATQF